MPRFRALDPLLLRIATNPAEDPTASRHAVRLDAGFRPASADEIVDHLRASAMVRCASDFRIADAARQCARAPHQDRGGNLSRIPVGRRPRVRRMRP
ncbi:hypothetical protein [Streptomyces sp. NBC_01022]|uniref:hypothetical protein n=1 Tax=Streptomyces sp. NBC_01022 TaxID=2903723 RepID=UPI002DD7F36F|nr:hypothetical protein [Streptomyces sp. NBC_01022]WRZ81613.1 hypothetical protein OG316_15735 [Streptomyces sp. NBC_01022]